MLEFCSKHKFKELCGKSSAYLNQINDQSD